MLRLAMRLRQATGIWCVESIRVVQSFSLLWPWPSNAAYPSILLTCKQGVRYVPGSIGPSAGICFEQAGGWLNLPCLPIPGRRPLAGRRNSRLSCRWQCACMSINHTWWGRPVKQAFTIMTERQAWNSCCFGKLKADESKLQVGATSLSLPSCRILPHGGSCA